MGVIDNEKGTAEILGVLLLFMISLVILGYTQTNLVPDWNKNLEMQQFDRIHDEFLDIRSDIQDAYIYNIPKTGSLSMGIRYPERYLLQNPGPGASGTLDYEPVNVTLKLDSNPSINYTSTRIRYRMNGISSEPELVYEHGLVITDFGGGKSFNESAQSLISGNDIFVPVLFAQGQQSVGSMLPQSFSLLPLSTNNYNFDYSYSTVNITLDTQYPDLWRKLTKNISFINVIGNGNAGKIYITRSVASVKSNLNCRIKSR